ncbi:transcriptional attenuator, LytR family [Streptomyces sp. DvalAA-14]|nr:transcriptional attenuator, LytR family [Streptomyces sp. DvalAA-14]
MDTQGRRNIDPADQWVLDPATGTYQLRLDPEETPSPSVPPQVNYGRVAERSATERSSGRPGPVSSAAAPAAPATDLAGPRRRRKAKPGMSRRRKALAWTGGAVGFVLLAGSVSGFLVYEHFNNNITTVDVGDAGSKSVTHEGPMNILVIGTDSRQGLGDAYGDPGSLGHADTTILFHVSADRSNATAVSIPRDIVTAIPDCPTKQKDGSTKVIPGTPKQLTTPKFNESLGQEGRDPGCTMRLVSQMMGGLRIDHFMMVDFEAVKTLSAAVGGVDVCLARPLVDPKSHLDLAAGRHTIQGEQALEFVRTRHALRNQSDLDRIKLQQNFLSAMIRQIKSSGTLTSPSKLWTLANAATHALTVDTAIGSVTKLSSLARDLSAVDTKHITFATLPVADNPDEKVHATVVVDRTRAPQLVSLIKRDVSLTQVKKRPAAPDPRLGRHQGGAAGHPGQRPQRQRDHRRRAGHRGVAAEHQGREPLRQRRQRARADRADRPGVHARPGRPGALAGRHDGTAGQRPQGRRRAGPAAGVHDAHPGRGLHQAGHSDRRGHRARRRAEDRGGQHGMRRMTKVSGRPAAWRT